MTYPFRHRPKSSRHSARTVVKVVLDHPDAVMPRYVHPGDAGMDISSITPVTIAPHSQVIIDTFIRIEIPRGFEGQIRPRSGLALLGITVANSPGTVDCGYREHVGVIAKNTTDHEITVPRGRIAQLVIAPVAHATLLKTNRLSDSVRGGRGFGSSGVA